MFFISLDSKGYFNTFVIIQKPLIIICFKYIFWDQLLFSKSLFSSDEIRITEKIDWSLTQLKITSRFSIFFSSLKVYI